MLAACTPGPHTTRALESDGIADVALLLKPRHAAYAPSRLQETLRSTPIIGPARNAILSLGDGMSLSVDVPLRGCGPRAVQLQG